ncbi:hypothetical protein H6F77_10115 [Microcoleus sp. FACHB-831]|uniref:hypothetical protein n=1 Tax=Microcoleus sp. FACHB-831 TaxID=2692827 RepID=UPI00168A39EB|nr:hypothetical protein [Microcoleus sp. FACHB-831]MBD1921444.1 hypothetical protein [Microcoleus sp. FACHB-831]
MKIYRSIITKYWGLWLQWVLVTCGGFFVSLLFVEVGERSDIGVLEGAVGGGAIALAQALVLRRHLPLARLWILATIVSWVVIGGSGIGAIGWVAPTTKLFALRVKFGFFDGAMVGALLGLMQWFVLRQQLARASVWILTNAASWAIGLATGWVAGGILRVSAGIFLGEIVGLALTWVVVAAITGVALICLLRFSATKSLPGY